MRILISLLVLLTGCKHAPVKPAAGADEPVAWGECVEDDVDIDWGGLAVYAKCLGWVAFQAETPLWGVAPDELSHVFVGGFAAGSGCVVDGEPRPAEIAGRALQAQWLRCDELGLGMRTRVVWDSNAVGRVIVSGCGFNTRDPRGPARCDAVLADLVANGVPDVPKESAATSGGVFMGRRIPVPEGCEEDSEPFRSHIACESGLLDWVQLSEYPPGGDLDGVLEQFAAALTGPDPDPHFRSTSVGCTLGGTPGTCRELRQTLPDGVVRVALIAYAEPRGIPHLATCKYRGDGLPAICAELIRVTD